MPMAYVEAVVVKEGTHARRLYSDAADMFRWVVATMGEEYQRGERREGRGESSRRREAPASSILPSPRCIYLVPTPNTVFGDSLTRRFALRRSLCKSLALNASLDGLLEKKRGLFPGSGFSCPLCLNDSSNRFL